MRVLAVATVLVALVCGAAGYAIGHSRGEDAGRAERVDPIGDAAEDVSPELRAHDDEQFRLMEQLCRMASHLPAYGRVPGMAEPTNRCFARNAVPTFDQHATRMRRFTDVVCGLVEVAVAPRPRRNC